MSGELLEAILLIAAVTWFLITIPVLALMYTHGQRIREKRQQIVSRRWGD